MLYRILFIFIVCITLFTTTNEDDCSNITPSKPSDCKLSQNDINNNYKYCCYEESLFGDGYSCVVYTEETYNILFDANPYILNLEPFEIEKYINERKNNGENMEDIVDDLDSNPYLFNEL